MTPEQIKLLDLRTSGFHQLKPGRIHLRCPSCGMKRSNVDRSEYDPATAVLLEAKCPECCGGDFDSPEYFDSNGCFVDACHGDYRFDGDSDD